MRLEEPVPPASPIFQVVAEVVKPVLVAMAPPETAVMVVVVMNGLLDQETIMLAVVVVQSMLAEILV